MMRMQLPGRTMRMFLVARSPWAWGWSTINTWEEHLACFCFLRGHRDKNTFLAGGPDSGKTVIHPAKTNVMAIIKCFIRFYIPLFYPRQRTQLALFPNAQRPSRWILWLFAPS